MAKAATAKIAVLKPASTPAPNAPEKATKSIKLVLQVGLMKALEDSMMRARQAAAAVVARKMAVSN